VELPEGHGVGVVVDDADGTEPLLQVLAERVVVPARHDGGVMHDPTGGHVHRAGHADAQTEDPVGRHPEGRQHLAPAFLHPPEDRLGTVGQPQVVDHLGERAAGEVADRDGRVRGAEVGGQHHPARAVEAEHVGRTPAHRRLSPGLPQIPGLDQEVDAGSDGGAGQPGELDQVPASAGPATADQVEQLPGALAQFLTPSRPRRSDHR
jgi:hypothetical protein